jgi:hypothetical protein
MSWPLPFLAPRADFSRVQQRPESKSGFGPTPEAAVTGAIDYSRRQPLGERAHRGLARRLVAVGWRAVPAARLMRPTVRSCGLTTASRLMIPISASQVLRPSQIAPLFKAETVNIAVSPSKNGKLRVVYAGWDDAKVILRGLERILPGARSQIGPPHRYL